MAAAPARSRRMGGEGGPAALFKAMLRVRRKKSAFRLVKNIPIPPVTPRENWTCVANPALDRAPVLLIPPLVTSKRPFVPVPLSIHRENGQRVRVGDRGSRAVPGVPAVPEVPGFQVPGGFRRFRVRRFQRFSVPPGTEPRTPNPEPWNPAEPLPRDDKTAARSGTFEAASRSEGPRSSDRGSRRTENACSPGASCSRCCEPPAIGERVSLSRACESISRLETGSVRSADRLPPHRRVRDANC